MYPMLLALLGTNLALVVFLFYGRFSKALVQAKFKRCFSFFVGPVFHEEGPEEIFSILKGRYRYSILT